MSDIPLSIYQREVSVSHRYAVRFGQSIEGPDGDSGGLAPYFRREFAIHAWCHLSSLHFLAHQSHRPDGYVRTATWGQFISHRPGFLASSRHITPSVLYHQDREEN